MSYQRVSAWLRRAQGGQFSPVIGGRFTRWRHPKSYAICVSVASRLRATATTSRRNSKRECFGQDDFLPARTNPHTSGVNKPGVDPVHEPRRLFHSGDELVLTPFPRLIDVIDPDCIHQNERHSASAVRSRSFAPIVSPYSGSGPAPPPECLGPLRHEVVTLPFSTRRGETGRNVRGADTLSDASRAR